MPPHDSAGVEPEDEPLGGGAGDQQEDTERAGGPGSYDSAGDENQAPEIAEDEDLATRLDVDPERGDVKG